MKSSGYKWEVFADHIATEQHKQCVKEALAETRTPKITLAFGNFRSNNGITTSGMFAQVSRIVNTVHTIIHKNYGINNLEDLVKLQLANGADMGDQYYSEKSFKELVDSFSYVIKQKIKGRLANQRFGFGMIDGTTDKAQMSQEAGLHRLFDTDIGLPQEIVLGLSALENKSAEGVFETFKNMYVEFGVDIDEVEARVVGAAMDGASVNMGEQNSVKTRIKAAVHQAIIIHCVNHALELVVSYAAKGHPDVEVAISMLEDVFKFCYDSPKKYRHLQKVADIFGTVIEHFGGLKNLRWCASQQRSWAALYNNYTTVVEHLSKMANAYAQFKLEDREQAHEIFVTDW